MLSTAAAFGNQTRVQGNLFELTLQLNAIIVVPVYQHNDTMIRWNPIGISSEAAGQTVHQLVFALEGVNIERHIPQKPW